MTIKYFAINIILFITEFSTNLPTEEIILLSRIKLYGDEMNALSIELHFEDANVSVLHTKMNKTSNPSQTITTSWHP